MGCNASKAKPEAPAPEPLLQKKEAGESPDALHAAAAVAEAIKTVESPPDTTDPTAQVAGGKGSPEHEELDTRLRFGMFEVAPSAAPQLAGLGAWNASPDGGSATVPPS